MKRILPVALILMMSVGAFAQNQEEATPTCYQRYAKVFEKRGAHPIADGVYDDVILSFRRGSSADCFYGKVRVKEGLIVKSEIFLKFEDNTYEKVVRQYKHPDDNIGVSNGISKTMVTMDDELINVMFVKKIKPKKKKYVRAPDPIFDLE